MQRALAGMLLLAAAVGGPYFIFESPAGGQLRQWIGLEPSTAESANGAPNESGGMASAASWGTNNPSSPQSQPSSFQPSSGWFTSTTSANGTNRDSSNNSLSLPTPPSSAAGTNYVPPGGNPSIGSNNPQSGTYPPGYVPSPGAPYTAGPPGVAANYGLPAPVSPAFDPTRTPANGETPLPYPPIQALQEILRFDISPNWVIQRFPRVNTVSNDPRLHGLQVALVTGSTLYDLNGTLTYYFDPYKRIQRISLQAVTGDPTRFLAELQHAYQLQYQPSLGGDLYLRKWNGRPTSLVYTALAPVVTEDNMKSRYRFFAELNHPGLEFGMSNEAQQLLDAHANNRWQ